MSADPNKFHSMIRQPHRPNETAVHVGGFRGSKDGYLFFLENGIFWGFKKPLIFIPMSRIAAISYTSILQITFNMVVEIFTEEDGKTEELEFGMLDQQNYGGIDDYIKTNRLQDRSMAEQRKGKLQLAENRAPKKKDGEGENGDAEGADGAGNGMTELERAQLEAEQALQDDEDEDEEDYDPGSEGESEGSGSDDDDDDSDDEDDEDDEEDDEGEEGEGGEEEEQEEEKPIVKEEPPKPTPRASRAAKPAKAAAPAKPAKPAKAAAPPKPAKAAAKPAEPVKAEKPSIPVRTGWAAFTSRPGADVDMADNDDEKFDVVG